MAIKGQREGSLLCALGLTVSVTAFRVLAATLPHGPVRATQGLSVSPLTRVNLQ